MWKTGCVTLDTRKLNSIKEMEQTQLGNKYTIIITYLK